MERWIKYDEQTYGWSKCLIWYILRIVWEELGAFHDEVHHMYTHTNIEKKKGQQRGLERDHMMALLEICMRRCQN